MHGCGDMSESICLLIIDPQNDFHSGGSLAVPGAEADAERVSQLIREKGDSIDRIVITLDSHHKLHIAHGAFWESASGDSPPPFTMISRVDVESGMWVPRNSEYSDYVLGYIDKLEASGKFKLVIWPEHCIVGSPGHCVVAPIHSAANEWSFKKGRNIDYVRKGENNLTEMYSALAAEVPLDSDPSTKMNIALRESLLPHETFQKLVICGQALSHCVNYTARDIIKDLEDKDTLSRIVLLENCSSAVPGFESAAAEFVSDCRGKGVAVADVESLLR